MRIQKTHDEAIKSIDACFWRDAINNELVNLPRGFRSISIKCVFRNKLRLDGSIQRYKARLVVKEFT